MSGIKFSLGDFNFTRKLDAWELAWIFLYAYALFFALSIAMTQLFLILFILTVFFALRRDSTFEGVWGHLREKFHLYPKLWYFYSPLVFWFLIATFSALLGLAPAHSLVSLLKFSIYFILPLFIFLIFQRESDSGLAKVRRLLVLFVFSHGVAGLHTFVSSNLGYEIKPRVPGPLTESGQLELLFPLLFILPGIFGKVDHLKSYFMVGILLVCFWLSLAWLVPAKIALPFALLFVGMFLVKPIKGLFSREEILVLLCVSLSLSAVVLGLKRGPWFSIMVEIAILVVSVFGLRCLGWLVLLFPLFLFSEVRERIFSLSEHFFIVGGRFDMWKLGLELIERFPLGIGFGNSDLIRMFDSTLPLMHRHMHNNFLNIILECGLLGGLVFLIWLLRMIKMSWPIGFYLGIGSKNPWSLIRGAMVVSLVGWQIGGLVEYNFGDGEIRLFALVLLGIFLHSIQMSKSYELSRG